jgi:tetratricopeptide (TPR) repeat protein
MIKPAAIAFMICLCSFSFGNEWHDEADRLWNEAHKLKKERKYNDAIEQMKRAVIAERKNATPRNEELLNELNELGNLYEIIGNYEKSIHYYQLSVNVAREIGLSEQEVMALINMGQGYYNLNRLDAAVDIFNESLKKSTEMKYRDKMVLAHNNLGNTFRARKDFTLALEHFNKALEGAHKDDSSVNVAVITSNIGTLHYFRGNYEAALNYYLKASEIDKNESSEEYTSIDLSNIAGALAALGKYTEALTYINRALEIDKKNKKNNNIASRIFRMGQIYFRQGNPNSAIEAYTRSYEINAGLNNAREAATVQSSIGEVYESTGNYEEALEHYIKALNMNRDLEVKENIAVRLSDIGLLYETRDRHGEAVDYLSRALLSDMVSEKKSRIADNLSTIGRIMLSMKKYEKALEYFEKSLQLYRELKNSISMAEVLKNIGIVYFNQKAYERSIDFLWQGIRAAESGKLGFNTGIDDVMSDIYRWLISSYVKSDIPEKAFEVSNQFSIRRINKKGYSPDSNAFSLKGGPEATRRSLKKRSSVVIFTNIIWDNPILIYIDSSLTKGYELNKSAMVNEVYNRLGKNVEKFMGEKKTDIIFKIKQKSRNDYYYIEFEKILNYYRYLLSKKYISSDEYEQEQYLSQKLYSFLFGGIENILTGKEELIIQPEGALATIPFETLMMPDGRFMVEKFNIKYTYAEPVTRLTYEKINQTVQKQKAFLAIGNMNRMQFPEKKVIESLRQFELINEEVERRLKDKSSLLDLYGYFGIDEQLLSQFKGLDVTSMKSDVRNADIVYGVMASESSIKKMARSGQLSNYQIIHFSTNGLIVPEVDSIGALVVSARKTDSEEQDGLLSIPEISDLALRADMVFIDTLCIPPVGYNLGEGIGSFCNAFIHAGAHSVGLTLWAVDDSARMLFLKHVYKQVLDGGIAYDLAMTAVKRSFIRGEIGAGGGETGPTVTGIYKNPYFWGAYIYYGY